MLPSLSSLSIKDDTVGATTQRPGLAGLRFYFRWIAACGGWDNTPVFTKWGSSSEKRAFRGLVNKAENDRFSVGQYNGPYTNTDVDQLIDQKTYSVEHIIPRSMVNDRDPGRAEDDFFGWDLAHRDANSERSNLPLVLWNSKSLTEPGRSWVSGELHYNPLEEHKPRLARRWIYIRLTYYIDGDIDPPSEAQINHMHEITQMAKRQNPVQRYAEKRLHALLVQRCKEKYGVDWQNPLHDDQRDALLDDPQIISILSYGSYQKR